MAPASAQTYPVKPIRVVATGVGSASDLAGRMLGPVLAEGFGQPVVIDNRVGGMVIAEIVSKAQPDGYTLLLSGSAHWLWPLMQTRPSYDPVKDFSPVSSVTMSPLIVTVNPSLAAKSIRDLISLAKAKPGELNYASGALGAASHLAPELFKSMAGVDIVHIPYKGSGAAIIDLIGGRVHVAFTSAGAVVPHIKTGKLRGLAVTSGQPSALLPDMPTVSASGVPGFEAVSLTALFAPAKTPRATIDRVNRELNRVLDMPEIRDRFFRSGVETAGNSPEQLAATMTSEIARLGKVIAKAGIRVQ